MEKGNIKKKDIQMTKRKKGLIILFISLLGFSFATHAQTKSFKRGVGFNNMTEQEIELLSPGLSWVYNWGQSVSNYDNFTSNGVDYIPMAWSNINLANARTFLTAHPEIKYILGFNEPNIAGQATMTPEQAASRWADVETIADEFNLKIVGPAVNYSATYDPYQWYTAFLDTFCVNCRVDYIALHFYLTSASSVMNSVASFKKYGKPVWLTEFCYDKASSAKDQINFMVATFDSLETNPDIVRYAWFMDKASSNYNGLFAGDSLTDLGEVFTYMSSYDDNFYFTTDMQIPATQYIRMNRVNMEKTTDESGHINLLGMNDLSWAEYNIDIPEDGEYNLFFRVSSEYAFNSNMYVLEDGNQAASIPFNRDAGIGVWNTQSGQGMFHQGKHKIRIGFSDVGLKINWFAITKSDSPPTTGIESPVANDVKAYPNPVKDLLNLQVPANTQVTLRSICGNSVYSGKSPSSINMSAFPQGVYILDMRFENGGRKVEKIIKEK